MHCLLSEFAIAVRVVASDLLTMTHYLYILQGLQTDTGTDGSFRKLVAYYGHTHRNRQASD